MPSSLVDAETRVEALAELLHVAEYGRASLEELMRATGHVKVMSASRWVARTRVYLASEGVRFGATLDGHVWLVTWDHRALSAWVSARRAWALEILAQPAEGRRRKYQKLRAAQRRAS